MLRSPSRRTQTSTTRRYLLSGTVRCGRCMFATPAGTGAARYMAYRCRTAHLMRRLDQVDDLVVGAVIGRLARPDAAALLRPDVDLDGLRQELGQLRDRRDELAQAARRRAAVRCRRARAGPRADGAPSTDSSVSWRVPSGSPRWGSS